jgi:hypothetical protein
MSAMSTEPSRAHKKLALDLILDAWDKALKDGADPDLIASAALYAVLADMVERYGAEAVAEFCAELPERVRAGEFTLSAGDEAH